MRLPMMARDRDAEQHWEKGAVSTGDASFCGVLIAIAIHSADVFPVSIIPSSTSHAQLVDS